MQDIDEFGATAVCPGRNALKEKKRAPEPKSASGAERLGRRSAHANQVTTRGTRVQKWRSDRDLYA